MGRPPTCPTGYFVSRTESSGPDLPLGCKLGPEGLNRVAGSVPTSNNKPTKQLLISSQFCGPHQTCLEGSGLNLLFTELSKCEMPIRRVPLGSGIGLAKL